MTPTTPLTAAEHRALGAELAALSRRLVELTVALANENYGISAPSARRAMAATHAVDQLRSALDTQFSADHRHHFDPTAYHPTGDRPDPEFPERLWPEIHMADAPVQGGWSKRSGGARRP